MIIHICCSVDSHFFLQKIKEDYPNEELIGFFYNPNIHPYSEYCLRLEDVKYSCNILGIKLIEGNYDLNSWLQTVKGLENEPEKGNRCTVCFDKRLLQTVNKTVQLQHKTFTTTLLMSPKKSQEKLLDIGEKLASMYNLKFIFKDYRKNNGMELQAKEVKQNNLYRQNYCGCLFGLTAQREQQDKLMDEMFSPINNQLLNESIEERILLYRKRTDLIKNNIQYKIIKERFLNYRLLSGKIIVDNKTINSYFLPYSTANKTKTIGKIEYEINNIYYLNKNEIKFIDIKYFNKLANTNYKNTLELSFNPILFEQELSLKNNILNNIFDLSCLIVLDTIPKNKKITIYLNSKIYPDTKDRIITV